jgi:hypothetical protein
MVPETKLTVMRGMPVESPVYTPGKQKAACMKLQAAFFCFSARPGGTKDLAEVEKECIIRLIR